MVCFPNAVTLRSLWPYRNDAPPPYSSSGFSLLKRWALSETAPRDSNRSTHAVVTDNEHQPHNLLSVKFKKKFINNEQFDVVCTTHFHPIDPAIIAAESQPRLCSNWMAYIYLRKSIQD